jgi:type I restriction enzyme ecoKI R protein (R.ecoKI)
MQSNFVFLQNDFSVLYQIGIIAEKYLYTDSNVCLIKLGMFGETVVNIMLQLDKISAPQTGSC